VASPIQSLWQRIIIFLAPKVKETTGDSKLAIRRTYAVKRINQGIRPSLGKYEVTQYQLFDTPLSDVGKHSVQRHEPKCQHNYNSFSFRVLGNWALEGIAISPCKDWYCKTRARLLVFGSRSGLHPSSVTSQPSGSTMMTFSK
jgi:hypothetical protein